MVIVSGSQVAEKNSVDDVDIPQVSGSLCVWPSPPQENLTIAILALHSLPLQSVLVSSTS